MGYYTQPPSTFGTATYARPTTLFAPRTFDSAKTYPLILMIHSDGATGADVRTRLDFNSSATFDDGVFLFAPDGINHGTGTNYWDFWTAPAAGNDFDFLVNGLVLPAIAAIAQIDPKRIYVIGYSDGGFMAHQLSLQYPALFTAGFTLAAAGGVNDSVALASKPIPWAHFHGGADTTVLPAGDPLGILPAPLSGHGGVGSIGYDSTTVTAAAHNSRNGGAGTLQAAYDSIAFATNDLAATQRQAYSGTTSQTAVELWQAAATAHTINLVSGAGMRILAWMNANHRTS